MENLMKAIDAFNKTGEYEQKEYKDLIHCINDGICDAASAGQYETTVYFGDITERLQDKIYTALCDAGYYVLGIYLNHVTISWESIATQDAEEQNEEVVEPSPAEVKDEKKEEVDDYKRYVEIPLGYLKDWVRNIATYEALKNGGVDDWDWYGDSIADYCEICGVTNIDEVADGIIDEYIRYGIIVE